MSGDVQPAPDRGAGPPRLAEVVGPRGAGPEPVVPGLLAIRRSEATHEGYTIYDASSHQDGVRIPSLSF
jgi:hypothetical protein